MFRLTENNTNVRTEILAGVTTFLSMAYILFVNPDILSATGMDKGALFVATALAAVVGTLIMAFLANYPIALAPGMGLNAFFTFSVVNAMGIPWQTALTAVFISGVIFFILTLFKIRETIINAIPAGLKFATSAGIGLFITFIGLKNAGIVVEAPPGTTAVQLGDLHNGNTLLAILGLVLTVIFMVRRINGGIFYAMLITALVGMMVGLVPVPAQIVSASIPSLEPVFAKSFAFDQVLNGQMLVVIFTFLFVVFFDTTGTLLAVANQAGFVKDNKIPRVGRALTADSLATLFGAVIGTSTTTSYIESSSGVAVGGRTGLTAVVTAVCFALALFFSPLLAIVTPAVTAPALIMVGVLMASSLGEIKWRELDEAIPAFLTVIAMPLTYSISTGIALGFILYPLAKIVRGQARAVHPIMYVLFVVFLIYFIWLIPGA